LLLLAFAESDTRPACTIASRREHVIPTPWYPED
jgi:hypothetical protein